jgi:hypothetical protein
MNSPTSPEKNSCGGKLVGLSGMDMKNGRKKGTKEEKRN